MISASTSAVPSVTPKPVRAVGVSASRGWRVGAACALFTWVSVLVSGASAQDKPEAVLVFKSATQHPSCPTERELRDAVVSRLGYDPFVVTSSRRVTVSLSEKDRVVTGVVAQVDGAQPPVMREFSTSAADCAELGESLAVSIALALNPLGATSEPSAAASAPEASEPSATPDSPPPMARRPAPESPPRKDRLETPAELAPGEPRVSLEFAPSVSLGRAPSASFGARVGVMAEFATQRGSPRGSAWALGAEVLAESTPGFIAVGQEKVSVQVGALGVVGCHRAPRHLVCALGSIGVAQGEADDQAGQLVSAGPRRTLIAAVGGRVGVPLQLGERLALEPALDVFANVVKTQLLVDDTPIWTAPAVGGSFGLGLRWLP